jgi:hypothetical protein
MDDKYLAYFGGKPERIPHWEHWSCPDAETFISGIDHYEHPQLCRKKFNELYPWLGFSEYPNDNPIPRPESRFTDGAEADSHAVRWGDGATGSYEWGLKFETEEDVFNFSPLQYGDFRKVGIGECHNFNDEQNLYDNLSKRANPNDPCTTPWYYNTMFMWPMLVFDWEKFMLCCMDERFERIMNEFAELNRRAFKVLASLKSNMVICHDDICTSKGPVCNRAWMNKYIFPRYEEYWATLKASGKKVIYMGDGNVDAFVDDIAACGADGIISEPYTNYKVIAKKYPHFVLAGEGDNRVLSSNNPDAIKKMVLSMTETAKMTNGGYFYCIGNHIPWDIPPAAVKLYLDLCREHGKLK